jgi:hypothetical protein
LAEAKVRVSKLAGTLRVCAVSAALVTAVSARAAGPLPDISEARNDAVNVALTMDLITTALAANCVKLGGDTKKQAERARDQWSGRHKGLVEGAHHYLVLVRATLAHQKGPGAGKHYYDGQKATFVKQARAALGSYFPRGHPDAESCGTVIALLSSGTMDLSQKPVVFETLEKIRDDMRAMRDRK